MDKIIFCTNTSKSNYMYQQFHKNAKILGVELIDEWEATEDDKKKAIATLNRCYYEKYAPVQRGVQVNDFYTGYFYKSKMRQQCLEMPCEKPKTVLGQLGYDQLRELIGYPFVAKQSIASGGRGTYLIRSKEDFRQAIDCDIFQEMIWDSYGKDLRVYVIGGEIIGVMQRTNKDDFRANAHVGGKGSKYKVNKKIREITSAIYEQTKLDIMGIDLLFYKDTYMFCELNVNPGFEEFDSAMNDNVAMRILQYTLDKANKA